MTLDNLVQSIPDSESALRLEFSRWIDGWKRSAESVERLGYLVTKWHGNVWFQKAGDSDAFFQNWRNFKIAAIDGIGGMTLNERLHVFGLLELWAESDEKSRAVLQTKVNARP
jgi:hypothetical protein